MQIVNKCVIRDYIHTRKKCWINTFHLHAGFEIVVWFIIKHNLCCECKLGSEILLSTLANGSLNYYVTGMIIRQHFFTNRVFNLWNSLPNSIVSAHTVAIFKQNLDDFCTNQDMGILRGLRPSLANCLVRTSLPSTNTTNTNCMSADSET